MDRIVIPLAEGFEELEAITVTDLLRRARLDVVTAGLAGGVVTGSRGTTVIPDTVIENTLHYPVGMVVLPGGQPGSDNLDRDERVHSLLHSTFSRGGYVAAICAAPKVLARAGLLKGRRATAFPGVLEQMALRDTALCPEPVVCDDRVITSRGPGTAMDFALVLIETAAGRSRRIEVESQLQRSGQG